MVASAGTSLETGTLFFGEPEGDSKLWREGEGGGEKGPSDEQSTHAPNSLTGHCQAKSSSSSRRERERERRKSFPLASSLSHCSCSAVKLFRVQFFYRFVRFQVDLRGILFPSLSRRILFFLSLSLSSFFFFALELQA